MQTGCLFQYKNLLINILDSISLKRVIDIVMIQLIKQNSYMISVNLICHGRQPSRNCIEPNWIAKSGSGRPLMAVRKVGKSLTSFK